MAFIALSPPLTRKLRLRCRDRRTFGPPKAGRGWPEGPLALAESQRWRQGDARGGKSGTSATPSP
ncbi:protein of unknown function [Azospirillum baldaniorum]|uniref:Uncharacterized protein n=1 Tax=Azospirillum baldaniorum TaxID=1064539 RepID=A0A9P1NN55_9PROT|nr:protein of unknown function [Azospirillum baldaniorum]